MSSIHATQVKGARNQTLFLEVNERVEGLQDRSSPSNGIDFICECFLDDCLVTLTLTHHEYLAVRSESAWFFVAPDHVDERIEKVLGRRSTYWIVEKIDAAELPRLDSNQQPSG